MKQALVLPVLVAIISVIFFSIPTVTAAGPLDLNGVNNFAILANTYTNSGTGTVLNGDLGYTVPPATPPTVSGTTFISTDSTYISAEAIQAKLIASANDPTQSGACTTTLTAATVLDSLAQPLTPGVYCIEGAVSINTVTTLSGDGVYIFRMGGALNTVAGSIVKLDGNAKADNVFWVPVGATTLGANSVFAGNVLSNAAITVGTTVSMDGRILSNGAVTTGALATITAPKGITSPDSTPPVITLLGANPQIIQVGGVYTELGASVFDPDNVGLVAIIDSSAVNTSVVGSYLVTYNAVDPAGNHATQVTRTVNVVAIIPPPTVTPGIITLSDQTSCQSPSVGGVWDSITSTCTVATLVIGPGDNLVVASNVVFNIGTVTSSGSIENWGTINIASGGVITTSGALSNHGMIASNGGTITNSGPFSNFGTLASSGTITNGPTGVIQSSGIITSSGVITSSGTILVNKTGILVSSGVLTNSLNMVNEGTIMTSGTFTNSGPVMNIGEIKNQGLITNSNTITNFGEIFNQCGGSITNSGTIAVHTVIEQCVA